MSSRKKYSYKLKTLSKVILSPREQGAFSPDSDGKYDKKIIYPFYQYGEYEKYQPDSAHYYFPGSSLKGMLFSEKISGNNPERSSNDILVDDISVSSTTIILSTLNKFQKESKNGAEIGEFKSFFPNVAVEMCQQETELIGELFCENNPSTKIIGNHKSTLYMLIRLRQRLEELLRVAGQKDIDKLQIVLKKLQELVEAYENNPNRFLGILGGYKGRTLSFLFQQSANKENEKNLGGIFIDPDTNLPYGLVEISNLVKVNA